jgi:hypothetical protein
MTRTWHVECSRRTALDGGRDFDDVRDHYVLRHRRSQVLPRIVVTTAVE